MLEWIAEWFNSFIQFFVSIFDHFKILLDWIAEKWELTWEYLESLPRSIADSVLSAIAYVFENLPVPDGLLNTTFTIPPDFLFWMNIFNVPQGLGIIASALGLRFILRRLPFIG